MLQNKERLSQMERVAKADPDKRHLFTQNKEDMNQMLIAEDGAQEPENVAMTQPDAVPPETMTLLKLY